MSTLRRWYCPDCSPFNGDNRCNEPDCVGFVAFIVPVNEAIEGRNPDGVGDHLIVPMPEEES